MKSFFFIFCELVKPDPESPIQTSTWGAKIFPVLWHLAEGLFYFLIFFSKKEGFFVQNVVPREFGHRDNNFRTINYLQNSNFMYNIYERTSLPISIQKNSSGFEQSRSPYCSFSSCFFISYILEK